MFSTTNPLSEAMASPEAPRALAAFGVRLDEILTYHQAQHRSHTRLPSEKEGDWERFIEDLVDLASEAMGYTDPNGERLGMNPRKQQALEILGFLPRGDQAQGAQG